MTIMVYKLKSMTKGWFVGNFWPTVLSTNEVEVAVKEYKAGQGEGQHYHRLATEITVIVAGEAVINGSTYRNGDIIVIEPLTVTEFYAVTDVITTVVKYPGASDDKYEGALT